MHHADADCSSNGNGTANEKTSHPTASIQVVVVESHHHALEHVHAMLRRNPHLIPTTTTTTTTTTNNSKKSDSGKGKGNGWSMLHWDSHADLACPGPHIPAVACFRPRQQLRAIVPAAAAAASVTTTIRTPPEEASIQPSDLGAVPTVVSLSRPNRYEWVESDEEEEEGTDDDSCYCLYDLMDSTPSGISEWILPLVWAANLRRVHWVRPHTATTSTGSIVNVGDSHQQQQQQQSVIRRNVQQSVPPPQIPTGTHTFRVGAWMPPGPPLRSTSLLDIQAPTNQDAVTTTSGGGGGGTHGDGRGGVVQTWSDVPLEATLKVDWTNCVYYQHDHSIVPTHELLLSQPLTLTVTSSSSSSLDDHSQEPHCDDNDKRDNNHDGSTAVMIDVCLDYFACWNPFLTELDELPGAAPLAYALAAGVTASRLYSTVAEITTTTTRTEAVDKSSSKTQLDHFHYLWTKLLEAARWDEPEMTLSRIGTTREELAAFYDSFTDAQYHMETLLFLLREYQKDHSKEQGDMVIQLLTEAVPYCSMPHMNLDDDSSDGRNTLCVGTNRSIQDRLAHFARDLRRFTSPALVPLLVTIARSAVDGFTPPSVVDDLQDRVLAEIHAHFCGCCRPSFFATSTGGEAPLAGTNPFSPSHLLTMSAPATVGCRLRVHCEY